MNDQDQELAGKILKALMNNEAPATAQDCQFFIKDKNFCTVLNKETACKGLGIECEICPFCG